MSWVVTAAGCLPLLLLASWFAEQWLPPASVELLYSAKAVHVGDVCAGVVCGAAVLHPGSA